RNAGVISKIKVPKSIFVLSSTVASIFNFLLTMLVYFVFMIACRVNFGPHLILMIYPIICMSIFNIGIIYILSSLFVFFRDTQYLYSIVIKLLSYVSAIFYYADSMPDNIQIVFAVNPIYRYISYMRQLVIDSVIPSATSHLVCAGFAIAALILGYLFYKKTEKNFVYYY
ncbi:MAG: ABC transporter permease, partial [Ruminiclostridium sp.]|nr:ABC transporter permease [Ruminiclostridium sp.]